VADLSKAQLTRKRANDRKVQRAIRQRTKARIESLEQKIRELEDEKLSNLEKVQKRNEELECEVQKLRAQISIQPNALSTSSIPGADNAILPFTASQNYTMMPNSTMNHFPGEEDIWNGGDTIAGLVVGMRRSISMYPPYFPNESTNYLP
jgi:TolA-binding protein